MAQISDKDDSEIDAEEMARKFRLSYPRRMLAKWVFGKAFCFPGDSFAYGQSESRDCQFYISMLTYSSGSLSCSIRGLRLLRARGCSDPKSLDMLDRMPIPATKNRKG